MDSTYFLLYPAHHRLDTFFFCASRTRPFLPLCVMDSTLSSSVHTGLDICFPSSCTSKPTDRHLHVHLLMIYRLYHYSYSTFVIVPLVHLCIVNSTRHFYTCRPTLVHYGRDFCSCSSVHIRQIIIIHLGTFGDLRLR